jgi:hypothetical protein
MPERVDPAEQFKVDLSTLDDLTILDRYFYARPAAMLSNEQESSLRREVARKFQVSMRDVVVVGSAKLGFTLVGKRGRPSLSPFADTSDIDLAIISQPLFLRFWRRAFRFSQESGDWPDANAFRKYLLRGWLRPDRLPKDAAFPEQREWFEFFQALTASGCYGPFKIAAGIYYDELFWEHYTSVALAECKRSLEVQK